MKILYVWYVVLYFLLAMENSIAAPMLHDCSRQDLCMVAVAKQNPTFIVKLSGSPSTGYAWYLARYNQRLVTPLKWQVIPAATHKALGGIREELWTFKVAPEALVVPQLSKLMFVYARPWSAIVAKTVVVNVVSMA